jgi:hypothetical protein
MRPSMTTADVEQRVAAIAERLGAADANLDEREPASIATHGLQVLEQRGVLVRERQVWRVRERLVLRYYARSIAHLLTPPKRAAMAPRTP